MFGTGIVFGVSRSSSVSSPWFFKPPKAASASCLMTLYLQSLFFIHTASLQCFEIFFYFSFSKYKLFHRKNTYKRKRLFLSPNPELTFAKTTTLPAIPLPLHPSLSLLLSLLPSCPPTSLLPRWLAI